ncbi:type II secretion system F family protein [Magnetospirillum sp. 64-120]|uniref:type II secretion system F family protein n=1 Tax=Magnetospirillum sp. 64-120 TaxID=1895778 RepID=UPI00092C3E9D|nr:type II secretion system F family protein [Magnetospirillum sp. 64-120]OJX77720.1 MAG: pilus assembly protein TadB [Magnetospirillum sp. 64-120]
MANLPTVVALLVLALFAALGMFAWVLNHLLHGRRARLKRRVAHVVGRRNTTPAASAPRRRSLHRLNADNDNSRGRWAWQLREQLMRAGIRIEVRTWLAINVAIALVVWGVAWLIKAPPLLGPLLAAAAGFGLPRLVVGWLGKRRIARFTTLFADALDIVVRGLRSGLPLGECMSIIGREVPEPLGPEFRMITEGQKLGLSLEEAMARAVERTPTADFKYFAIVLSIQQQTGGNLAETLVKLSDVLRARKRMRDKIKAFSSEAVASALIIGSLPVVVAVLLSVVGPDYIGILFTNPTGHLLLGVGGLLMAVGALVMRKMINFDL